MNNALIRASVKATIAKNSLLDRLEARRESGADALEYVGMFLVAAAIVAAIITAVDTEIGKSLVSKITDAVKGIGAK
ncbi:Flp pilus assembly pilin Flp [Arcanobacterium wilhelmae]|uniref:Flp pilus assembly pilin Flp n=1 Tax=Arcanobacterium wilhelmae TaxID=1803177 RepID=A0ABT9NAY5_9ACTO|nr:hypothetical protein [Arcanobacterium wilhelmae]MDP9800879.1 Flp pilus assembly pilin Flp [Arcanobacterium wilhelmae]WFN90246.1 hypothetical protein P8A24_08695 [Arcanobacterium wilhelmae]